MKRRAVKKGGERGRKKEIERRKGGRGREEEQHREREKGARFQDICFQFCSLNIGGVVYEREKEGEGNGEEEGEGGREKIIRRALGISRTKAFYTITRTSSYKR